jgi:hypothetical protein
MSRRITLQHTLVAALAASIVAASPALAKPTDRVDRFDSPTSSLAGTSSPGQDLRGEHARDAARAAEMEVQPGQPTWPTNPEPVVKPAKAVPALETGTDHDVWLVVGVGLAATGIVGAGAAGAARRNRLRARRVAA